MKNHQANYKLHRTARIAIQCFVDAGCDESYVLGWCRDLSDREQFRSDGEVFKWVLQHLDPVNLANFATKCGIDPDDMLIAKQVIRKMYEVDLTKALGMDWYDPNR